MVRGIGEEPHAAHGPTPATHLSHLVVAAVAAAYQHSACARHTAHMRHLWDSNPRGETPIGLAGRRLNRSAKVSLVPSI